MIKSFDIITTSIGAVLIAAGLGGAVCSLDRVMSGDLGITICIIYTIAGGTITLLRGIKKDVDQ